MWHVQCNQRSRSNWRPWSCEAPKPPSEYINIYEMISLWEHGLCFIYSGILQFSLASVIKICKPAFRGKSCGTSYPSHWAFISLSVSLSTLVCFLSFSLSPLWPLLWKSCIFDMWAWRKVDHLWCQHFFVLLAGISLQSLWLLFSQRLRAWFWEHKRVLNVVMKHCESPSLLLSSVVRGQCLKFLDVAPFLSYTSHFSDL